MRIIDLSLPLHSEMAVYPGDPRASIELIEHFADTGWNTTPTASKCGTKACGEIRCQCGQKLLPDLCY